MALMALADCDMADGSWEIATWLTADGKIQSVEV
jgi:hypothetical protein